MSKLRRRRRVFVVDDEQILAEQLVELLRRKGLDAHFFEWPHEMLDVSRFSPPDLLVADVEIKRANALEFAIKVRECAPSCKVLLFSTHAGTNAMLESVRSAQSDFILLFGPARLTELLEWIFGAIGNIRSRRTVRTRVSRND